MLDNSTTLNHEFMVNYLNYTPNLKPEEERNVYNDYYIKTCAYIQNNHFTEPSMKTIEQVLNGGYYPESRLYGIICTIADAEVRKYLFKLAMAKQLIYDLENGRTTMIKGDQTYNVCPEFKDNLSLLGFIQTGMYTRRGQ